MQRREFSSYIVRSQFDPLQRSFYFGKLGIKITCPDILCTKHNPSKAMKISIIHSRENWSKNTHPPSPPRALNNSQLYMSTYNRKPHFIFFRKNYLSNCTTKLVQKTFLHRDAKYDKNTVYFGYKTFITNSCTKYIYYISTSLACLTTACVTSGSTRQ